jgi:hypothetical protein
MADVHYERIKILAIPGDVICKGVESSNKYARKWPILPFDVSRDFIISKEIGS